jgi:hypothetical protein
MGLHYDDAGNTLTGFMRFGSQWYKAAVATGETTYTTMRYFTFQQTGALSRFITPFVAYAQ